VSAAAATAAAAAGAGARPVIAGVIPVPDVDAEHRERRLEGVAQLTLGLRGLFLTCEHRQHVGTPILMQTP